MKKQANKSRIFLMMTVVSYAVSCFSLSFIPLIDSQGESIQRRAGNIIAGLFWAGLAAGIALDLLANREIRRNSNRDKKELLGQHRLPGIFTFSRDSKHLVIYGILLVGISVMVSDMIWGWVAGYIIFPVISLTLFLFAVHCIIDGKYYKSYVSMKEGVGNEK